MSKKEEEILTWLYRSIIGGLISVVVFFTASTYQDFKTVSTDLQAVKEKTAVQHVFLQSIDTRVKILENRKIITN